MGVLVAFFSLFLFSCSTSSYLVEAGVGQWKLFNRERPVQEVLASPNTAQKTKAAILTVLEAKHFAVEQLGLKATKNYTQYVQLDDEFVSYAVSASNALLLQEKKWKFPIVGEVPYLGFFEKSQAKEFAKKMEAADPKPDVWIRGVPAFSSLGWFSDPLYSSMIVGGEREIADTVIHESLHATVWVGDSVDFNEKLASFVGLEGSVRFLGQKYPQGEARVDALRVIAGEKIFGLFMRSAVEKYHREVEPLASSKPEAAFAAKEKFYRDLPKNYAEFFAKSNLKNEATMLPVKFEKWNNAAILAYSNYYSDYSVFEEMLAKCEKNLARFVRWIVHAQKSSGRFASAPEEYLGKLVREETCVE